MCWNSIPSQDNLHGEMRSREMTEDGWRRVDVTFREFRPCPSSPFGLRTLPITMLSRIAVKNSWVDDQLKFSKMLVITLNCMMTKRVLHLNNVGYVDEITKRHSCRWNTIHKERWWENEFQTWISLSHIFRPFTLPKNFLHFVLVFPIGECRVLLTFNGWGKFEIASE